MLNVEKFTINININLTWVTGLLHIFAPHQFIQNLFKKTQYEEVFTFILISHVCHVFNQ
jgi:hypothetical protein